MRICISIKLLRQKWGTLTLIFRNFLKVERKRKVDFDPGVDRALFLDLPLLQTLIKVKQKDFQWGFLSYHSETVELASPL